MEPLTQACFLSQSVARQHALIAQSISIWANGSLSNLACVPSEAFSRWYIYESFSYMVPPISTGRVNYWGAEQHFNVAPSFHYVPEYADNAEALGAGKVAGNLYHTAGDLKIVL